MHRHINIATYVLLGFMSALLIHSPGTAGEAWAADGQSNPESQAQPSQGAEVTIPEGVIGVSLHVGADRVGDGAQRLDVADGGDGLVCHAITLNRKETFAKKSLRS